MSTKQRMISPADLRVPGYASAPEEAKATALWLWLHLDPLGRGLMDVGWIAREMYPADLHPRLDRNVAQDTVMESLVMLAESGFLTTYRADGEEWILLLNPLKTDLRRTRILTPDPPADRPWTSVTVGGAGERAGARERARAQVRAEDAARAEAWAAVQADTEPRAEAPERPAVLDAPPMFCDDHMPHGAGRRKCGPCRDARHKRDEWLARRIYEQKLTEFHEQGRDNEEPF